MAVILVNHGCTVKGDVRLTYKDFTDKIFVFVLENMSAGFAVNKRNVTEIVVVANHHKADIGNVGGVTFFVVGEDVRELVVNAAASA